MVTFLLFLILIVLIIGFFRSSGVKFLKRFAILIIGLFLLLLAVAWFYNNLSQKSSIDPYANATQIQESLPSWATLASPSPRVDTPTNGADHISNKFVGDFSPYAKSWWHHGFTLTIDQNGSGTAQWRIYKFCKDDPTPPCDGIGKNDFDGGHAEIVFTKVDKDVAYGEVVTSNHPNGLEMDSIRIKLLPYDMAELIQGSKVISLCGPQYSTLAPESLLKQHPCGA